MSQRVQKHQRFLQFEKRLIFIVFLVTAIFLIFPNETILINRERSAYYYVFAYAALSIGSLFINSKKLIVAMFLVTGILVLFLKLTLDSQVEFAPSNHTDQLDVQLIYLDQLKGDEAEVNTFVQALDGDIIFFQGYTPDWRNRLKSVINLRPGHTFVSLERIDLFGHAMWCKRSIKTIDTLEFEDIPLLRINLPMNEFDEIRILNFLLPPGLTRGFKEQQKKFIDQLVSVNRGAKPSLLIGNFNLTPWADNLQYLKYKTDAKCSRVNKSRLNVIQENPFDYYPTAHVLYNRKLQNIFFEELKFDSSPVGVSASYQIKK